MESDSTEAAATDDDKENVISNHCNNTKTLFNDVTDILDIFAKFPPLKLH